MSFKKLPHLMFLEVKEVDLGGPSGCGKSTLLRTINWLTPPDSGNGVLQGDIIGSATGKLTIKQTRLLNNFRARIGMVFQQFNVWPHLNVLENVIKAQVVVGKKCEKLK